jgi:hypothetical protein
MNFKLVSKNNMGLVATLLLVILLSQSRFLNFLINTHLGRAILIMIILGISYTNKILGVVSVLFIIIIFNQSNLEFMEGFSGTTAASPNTPEKVSDATPDKIKAKEEELKLKRKQLQAQMTATTSSVATADPSNATASENSGREGFNMIDREGTMLRGKRSNEVPVFNTARSQNDYVEPADKGAFLDSYASF